MHRSLPLIPGYIIPPPVDKTNFHRSQIFCYKNKVPLALEDKGSVGGIPLASQPHCPELSSFPEGEGPSLPVWVALDKQALCFDGFWQEDVSEMQKETYRVHLVKIFFFLEDDSIQVLQPNMKNSGLFQGVVKKNIFLRRHRIRKPPPNDDKFYNINDFNIGKDLTFYGRTFRICGCSDAFTEHFLTKLGMKLGEKLPIPVDPYSDYKEKMEEIEQMPLRPYDKMDTRRQFLDHDRHVLRFYGYWDDRESLFGDLHDLTILYFLADDTIEIREKIIPNSGKESFPVFLCRSKLPKRIDFIPQPGSCHDQMPLKIIGPPTPQGKHFILDNIRAGECKMDYYKDSDLMIGAVLNVWGRKVILTDCDDFTKHFYRTKYGITEFVPLTRDEPVAVLPIKEIPPHNGFGSEEDSLENCKKLVPSKPPIDFIKFITLDRFGENSHILRFSARFEEETPLSKGRLFVISCYLKDDSILVSENQLRNTGVIGGKFMQRQRFKKPIVPNPPPGKISSEYYLSKDFEIGKTVELLSFRYLLVDADEYTLKYMEDHPEQFPQANINLIMKKLKFHVQNKMPECRKMFSDYSSGERGIIQFSELRHVIQQLVNNALSEHEIITISRHYGKKILQDPYALPLLIKVAQETLKKINFDDFELLLETFKHYDMKRCGLLERENIYKAARSHPLPLHKDHIQKIVERLDVKEDNLIEYERLVSLLDWKKNPSELYVPPHIVFDNLKAEIVPGFDIQDIRYLELLDDLQQICVEQTL